MTGYTIQGPGLADNVIIVVGGRCTFASPSISEWAVGKAEAELRQACEANGWRMVEFAIVVDDDEAAELGLVDDVEGNEEDGWNVEVRRKKKP